MSMRYETEEEKKKQKLESKKRMDDLNSYLGDDLILTPMKTKSKYSKKWKIETRVKGKKKVEKMGYVGIKCTRPKKTLTIEPIELKFLEMFYTETLWMVCCIAAMRISNNGEYKVIDCKKYKVDFRF